MASQRSSGHLLGQFLGALVMLAGIAIICGVLWLAFGMFRDPNLGLGPSTVKPLTATDIGVRFIGLIMRIALLFLGSISGSLIGNKGIRLFFASLPGGERPR